MKSLEAHRLAPWEDGALRLCKIIEENGCLIASGDRMKFILPMDMKSKLAKCLEMRISFLRTDTGIRLRILDEPPND